MAAVGGGTRAVVSFANESYGVSCISTVRRTAAGQRPLGLVMAGPANPAKEQTPLLCGATKGAGYIVLAVENHKLGGSEGDPRPHLTAYEPRPEIRVAP